MTKSWRTFSRLVKQLARPRNAVRDFKVKRRIRREIRSDEHLYYEHDGRYNQEIRTPPDEQINLQCIWAVEFYTPRHFEDLSKNLSKLDEALALSGPRDATLSQWFEQSQREPFGQRWADLGLLKRPGTKFPSSGRDRTVELPPGVAYATGSIASVSSRIKYAVIRFVLQPDFSAAFQTELNTYRHTEITYMPYGANIKDPALVKRQNIDQTRIELSKNASAWFKQHLPGIFTDRLSTNLIPICEYIKLNIGDPFPELYPHTPPSPRYLRAMGLGPSFVTWQHRSDPRIKFSMTGISSNLPHQHCTVTFTKCLTHRQIEPKKTDDQWMSPDFVIDKTIQNVLPIWSALAMLEQYEEQLNAMRDAQIHSNTNRHRSITALETLGQALTWTGDIEGAADDISEIVEREPGYELVRTPARSENTSPSLLAADLNMMVIERTQRVKTTLKQVRRELLHHRETISISASIRLQQTMKWLAITSVVLASAGIALTATNIDIPNLIRSISAVFS